MKKSFLNSIKERVVFIVASPPAMFLLAGFLFICYYAIYPFLKWCFTNPFALLKIAIACICGVFLFFLYVWLVKKIKNLEVRIVLYGLFFLVIFLVVLMTYGIGIVEIDTANRKITDPDHEVNPLVPISFFPLGLCGIAYLCFKIDKKKCKPFDIDADNFGEDILIFLLFTWIIATSVVFVLT